jgi:molybdopterin-binding protein
MKCSVAAAGGESNISVFPLLLAMAFWPRLQFNVLSVVSCAQEATLLYIVRLEIHQVTQRLLSPTQAAQILGISYPTLKQWIYRKKLKSIKTPGGHHRIPESEIDRLIPRKLERGDVAIRRGDFRSISGRNQLMGRVLEIKFDGLMAQVTLGIDEQRITSIITADAATELRLKVGDRAIALIKSTEVMILRV